MNLFKDEKVEQLDGDVIVMAYRLFPNNDEGLEAASNYWDECNSIVGSNGPGREFVKRPTKTMSRSRILVTQVRGLDV